MSINNFMIINKLHQFYQHKITNSKGHKRQLIPQFWHANVINIKTLYDTIRYNKLETVSIAEPLQKRQHAQVSK